MSTTRKQVIDELKNHLVSQIGWMDAEHVVYRSAVDLSQITDGGKVVFMLPIQESGINQSSDDVERIMTVVVALCMGVDISVDADEFDQLDAVWNPIHAAIETFADNDSKTYIGSMHEHEDGQFFDGIGDEDRIVMAQCGWVISYIRKIGA